jgi:hypothetical protein
MYRFLAVVAAVLFAMPCMASASHLSTPSPAIIVDLDGDHQNDVAKAARTGNGYSGYVYQIDVALSGPKQATPIIVSSTLFAGIVVTPIDLDGDRDLDLVIASQPFHVPIAVWINDGSGRFERGDVNHYPDSIWSATTSLQPSTLNRDDDSLDISEYPAFHCTVYARAQIPDSFRAKAHPTGLVSAPHFYLKFSEFLRAPPNPSL